MDPDYGWWKDTLNYLANIPPGKTIEGVKLDGQDDAA
jgi:hypothetical protein